MDRKNYTQFKVLQRLQLIHPRQTAASTYLSQTENGTDGQKYNELSQKTRFQSEPIVALCLYSIQRKNSLCTYKVGRLRATALKEKRKNLIVLGKTHIKKVFFFLWKWSIDSNGNLLFLEILWKWSIDSKV